MKRKYYALRSGNVKRLKIYSEDTGPLSNQKVRISVRSIGLNFADVFAILGLYSATPEGIFTPGLEYSGIVTDVGDEVEEFSVGDRVMGVTRFGAYTTSIDTDPGYILPIPGDWTFQEGAAYLVQVLTAYYGLVNLGNLQEGMRVLIHSGAGGVGIWANRIARAKGAWTLGTVGNTAKLAVLEQEGYNAGIVRNVRTFEKDVIAGFEGHRPDLVMECIGGEIMKSGWKIMAPMGRMVLYGSAHYGANEDKPNYPRLLWKYVRRPRLDPQNMIAENKGFLAFNLIYLYEKKTIMRQLLSELSEMNLGKPRVGREFSFDQLPDAIRYFRSGKSVGKVVVNVYHPIP
jgi:alcohol dehydrogenase